METPTFAVRHASWDGRSGVEALRSVGDFVPASTSGFHAEWHGVEVDGVQIAEWRCTETKGRLRPDPAGMLRIDVVLGGRACYRFADHQVMAEPGSVLLFQVDRPFAFASRGDFRVGQVRLHRERLPSWMHRSLPAPDGLLTPSTLTTGYVALIERLTQDADCWRDPPAPGTAAAIGVIAAALLQEAALTHRQHADLHSQMTAYIDRHLDEQDLGPQRLAAAFGVSLRWAHHVFARSGSTIARHIREQRLDAVAHHLQRSGTGSDLAGLARRYGFAGRDRLTRSFKERYGTTPSQFVRDEAIDQHDALG